MLGTQKYICTSRPRRFGKSMAANMLTANYSRGCDSRELFRNLKITKAVCRDIFREYPDIDYLDKTILSCVLDDVFEESKMPFVIIIDEWYCIFRVHKNDRESQKKYLDFLRNLMKDQSYVSLAYMTGILPQGSETHM